MSEILVVIIGYVLLVLVLVLVLIHWTAVKKIVDGSWYKMKTCSAQVYRELKGKKANLRRKGGS